MRHSRLIFVMVLTLGWAAGLLLSPARAAEDLANLPIKKIFIIFHAHLDIGYTNPPSVVARQYKTQIDREIGRVKTDPNFKWNIEETWQLRQWMERSTPQEIEQLMRLIKAGRIGLMGGHSTLHATKAGVEELNRLVYDAERLRRKYGVKIDTVMHNDAPGVPWSYPQVLAKGGMKNLVTGMNMFVGGGFDAPYHPYLFNWQGPDGSKVLTWVTWDSYTGTGHGFNFWWSDKQFKDEAVAKRLSDAVKAGYPYDAYMLQAAIDNETVNHYTTPVYEAVVAWNLKHESPKMVPSTPDDFFSYITSKYSDIPTTTGSWACNWDTSQIMQPRSEAIVKSGHDQTLTAEKLNSLAGVMGKMTYPKADLDRAWDMMLTVDEHTGSGNLEKWPMQTREEADLNCKDSFGFALSAQDAVAKSMAAGEKSFFAQFQSDRPRIVVFNPSSWPRTDVVRVPLAESWRAKDVLLYGGRGGANSETALPCQVESRGSSLTLMFAAREVPAMGYATYEIREGKAKPFETSLQVSPTSIENKFYRVSVDTSGTITSIYDKKAKRELIDRTCFAEFNGLAQRGHVDNFMEIRPAPVARPQGKPTIGPAGTVAATLRIAYPGHVVAAAEVTLYDQIDRIDIRDTIDGEKTHRDAATFFSLVFPLNMASPTIRVDTHAGWLDPKKDIMPGAYVGRQNVHHGVDLSTRDMGVTFASADVYTHEFQGFPSLLRPEPTTNTLILSDFMQTMDNGQVRVGKNATTVTIVTEPGGAPTWDLRYSLAAHRAAFDPRREAVGLWESCESLVGAFVPAGKGKAGATGGSFFAVDKPNVIIFDVKKAEFGEGLILKMQEIGGIAAKVSLSSPLLGFAKAVETNGVERDIAPLPFQEGRIEMSFRPHEIKCVRLLGVHPAADLVSAK